jgi:hypothetical protein
VGRCEQRAAAKTQMRSVRCVKCIMHTVCRARGAGTPGELDMRGGGEGSCLVRGLDRTAQLRVCIDARALVLGTATCGEGACTLKARQPAVCCQPGNNGQPTHRNAGDAQQDFPA